MADHAWADAIETRISGHSDIGLPSSATSPPVAAEKTDCISHAPHVLSKREQLTASDEHGYVAASSSIAETLKKIDDYTATPIGKCDLEELDRQISTPG